VNDRQKRGRKSSFLSKLLEKQSLDLIFQPNDIDSPAAFSYTQLVLNPEAGPAWAYGRLYIGCGICQTKYPMLGKPVVTITSIGKSRSLENQQLL